MLRQHLTIDGNVCSLLQLLDDHGDYPPLWLRQLTGSQSCMVEAAILCRSLLDALCWRTESFNN